MKLEEIFSSYETFIKWLKEENLYKTFSENYSDIIFSYRKFPHVKEVKEKEGCITYWYVGGLSGGSCWDEGESKHYYRQSYEKEPDLKDLDNLFDELKLNLNFRAYKKIISECIKYDEYTECEYYGNTSEYKIKYVEFKDLYNILYKLVVEKGENENG